MFAWSVLVALAVAAPARASFTDVSASSGIDYVHAIQSQVPLNPNNDPARPTRTIQSNYAAAAAVDVDGDGWTDLLAARYALPPVLYMNQHDGTFREEAVARGLGIAVNAGAFGAGDFDNDGDQDLLIVPAKGDRYWLFVNDGTGHFTEEAVARGAAVTTTLYDHEAYSVGLVDYDRDGFLDIYVSEWGIPTSSENALHSVLLRNVGATAPGTFVNVTTAAGLTQPAAGATHQYGFSSAWADFDGDGWPDLALVGDFGSSQMWWNNGNGTFTESERASGVGLDEFGMGVAVADYDRDGHLDFYVTSIYNRYFNERAGTHTGNKLYRNLGGRRFAEVARSVGVDNTEWGWGAAFFEFDNDGDADLIVTNGMDAAQLGPTDPFNDALTDPTTLFQATDAAGFNRVTSFVGISDTGFGKAVVVWDYDRDGDEDLLITNTFSKPVVYRSDASTIAGRDWIQFKFRGTTSNRDGYGAVVRVTEAGRKQTALFNPTNSYIGQREATLHFGLGATDGVLDAVEITWPSGVVQNLSNLATNQVYLVSESGATAAPVIDSNLSGGGAFAKDQDVTLSIVAHGNPAPSFVWEKDGVVVAGATGSSLRFKRVHPFDAGTYRVTAKNALGSVASASVTVSVSIDLASHSVARWWDEFMLDGIRKDIPNPPVHARNLCHVSAAMWDAFWPYEPEGWSRALPVFVKEIVSPADWTGGREEAQKQAISYAAYRVLTERFKNSPGKARTLFGFRWLMQQLGYDPDFTGTTGNSPAAVGNRIGYGVLAATLDDGANEANGYTDATAYVSRNDPMVVELAGVSMNDPSHWQPLALKHSVTQNGIVIPEGIQTFVGVNARDTRTFALQKTSSTAVALDPGPPPQFNSATHAAFVQEALDCIQLSAMLDPTDGATIDISPGAYLNNPLGSNAGTGHALNPFTGQPYAANIVKRGDYARVLAEFWADGPASETPPGHWNVILNDVTDSPHFVRRYAGVGAVLSPLEWDVRAYLALNGAEHDAACVAWGIKRVYDSARPISMIRYLGSLGQSSDPSGPSYNPLGLPLIPNLIEVVTAASSAPGQRHALLAGHVGKIAIRAWQGNPPDPRTEIGGVGWILAEEWMPYQLATFVTPAFPGYVSGHSTFSRAGAEVLTLLTGSPFFPGGLGEYHFKKNEFLTFEIGPTTDLTLQWATFYDAADQAGLSRLFGGIHPSVDDFTGRRLGSRIGLAAFLHAQALRNGGASSASAGLVNISSRGRSGTGDDLMIAGFVVEGDTPQPTLVRAVGPELQHYGISAASCEVDPRLELHRANDDAVLLANDTWSASPRSAQIAARAIEVGAFPLTAGGADAAELSSLPAGGYTVVTRSSAPAARGIALAEVYGRRLVNLSTRGRVGAGDDVLIAGFIIDQAEPMPVLVRAAGPALAAFNVSGALADPVLTVYRHESDGRRTVVAKNDNWSDDEKASLAADAAIQTFAFSFADRSKDAALFLQLPAGAYSAVVSSADLTEGVALAEVYHVK